MPERESPSDVLEDLNDKSKEVFEIGAEQLRRGYQPGEESSDDMEFKDTDPRLARRAQEIPAELDELGLQVFHPMAQDGEKKQALLAAETLLTEAEDINRRNNTIPQDLERLRELVNKIREKAGK